MLNAQTSMTLPGYILGCRQASMHMPRQIMLVVLMLDDWLKGIILVSAALLAADAVLDVPCDSGSAALLTETFTVRQTLWSIHRLLLPPNL